MKETGAFVSQRTTSTLHGAWRTTFCAMLAGPEAVASEGCWEWVNTPFSRIGRASMMGIL